MSQKPYLNVGAGRVILPAPKPAHYGLIPDGVCDYALWVNADRNAQPGIDVVEDLFTFPWSFEDNSFDGILFSHFLEHCPHEIRLVSEMPIVNDIPLRPVERKTADRLRSMQDGWFALMYEAWRVCTPGSLIHILSPYAWSDGAVTDPTHTRLLTPASFTHSMQPDPNAPFAYATGGLHLVMDEPPRVNLTPAFQHLAGQPERLQQALNTQINVAYEFYVRLRVIK